MEHVTEIFEQLLSMSATALPVMAVVLAVRWLLRKAPKQYSYLLWLVVAFRLVCPVSVQSAWSLFTVLDRVGVEASDTVEITEVGETGLSAVQPFVPEYSPTPAPPFAPSEDAVIVQAGPSSEAVFLRAAAMVWLVGMAAMAVWLIASTLRLRRQTALAVRREENVWECDGIPTPFVLGWLRPRIYIPFRMTESERAYILAHERYHIRRGDHWAKLAGLLILTVYWWNPAVWLCWVLFCRDMEMRCDEAVLAALGDGVKREYSLSLISFALDRRAPMALAFGEHDAAKRVKNVLRWKRAKPVVVFLAVAVVVIVAAVCGTNASQAQNRVTLRYDETGAVEYEVQMTEDIHSWAIYMDIYDGGRLIQSSHRVLDGFADENAGVSTRDFTGRLWADLEKCANDGFTNRLTWNVITFGGAELYEILPREHYTGMVKILGDGSDVPQKYKLGSEGGEVLLYSILLSTKPEGKVTTSAADKALTQANDTVVQYRLVLSSGTMDELPIPRLDLAQELFDLRAETVRDTEQVWALMKALDMDTWGACAAAPWTDGGKTLLHLDFEALEPNVILLDQINREGLLLTALIGDISGVRVSWPAKTGEKESAVVLGGEAQLDKAILETTGYESLKAMGRTPQGVRTLLEYLDWNMTTASAEANDLFKAAQTQEPWDFTETLMRANLWGGAGGLYYNVGWPGNFGPYITFFDVPKDPQSRDAAVARRAVVLMGLFPEVGYVMWSYLDENGETVRRELHRNEVGALLALSSSLIAIKTPESAEDLEGLLHFLGALTDKGVTMWAGEGNAFSLERDAEAAAVWFTPEDVHDIEYAALKGPGEDQRWYPPTGNDYDYLLSQLSSATEIPETNCAFSGMLYLHRADGVTGKMQVAVDDCGVFRSGGKYYRFDTNSSRFYTAFGVTAEHMISGTALDTALPDTVPEVQEDFVDLMGFSGYINTETGAGDWYLRTYYTIQGGGPRKIAETFGYGTPQEYAVDLDGDGVRELVANVTFGADGARRAYVYQRRGNDVYLGTLSPEDLPNFDSGDANAWQSEYDAGAGLFRIRYAQKNSGEYGVLETRDTGRLSWGAYTERGTETAYLTAEG